jgi:SIR2-like domain
MGAANTIAYLVGAGLSVDANLPHSVELAAKLKVYLQNQARDNRNADAKIQLALLYFLLGGIRFQWARLGGDPDQHINIEQIATAALRLRLRGKDPLAPYVASWNEKIIEFERAQEGAFERFSEMIYARLKEWLATPSCDQIEYINRMADLHSGETSVAIFSLNYDLLVETAFSNAGRCIINGFNDGHWSPELFADGNAIRVYKLHGSLDWVDDEMHGICSLTFDRHPRAEDFEVSKPPLLIFGTDSKLTGKDPFLTLVHAFSEQLRTANVLVVVGYSFSDQYINEIVEQRMRDNVPMRMVLVSPNADWLKQSLPFLENSPRVSTISKGALEAFNTGLVRSEVVKLLKETKQEAPF